MKYIETKNNSNSSGREMLIVFCALLSIVVSFLYPQKAYGETFWLSFFLFAVFPAVAVGFLLKEPLRSFGLNTGKPRTGIIISAAVIAVFVLANFYLVFRSPYGGQLTIVRGIAGSFAAFLFFEILVSLPLHFFWEFFFRGFIQLGLEKKLGFFSLIFAAALQAALSYRANWTIISLVLLSSLGAGLIVRQSRSVVYSALSLWIISVSLDIMIIRTANQIAG